jgi:hypothetical protein
MGNKTFNQFNIGRTPTGQNPPTNLKPLNLTLMSEPDGDKLSFYFEGKIESVTGGPITTRLDLDIIRENYQVTIKLDESTDWHWSNTLSAITTKKQLKKFYLDLRYSADGQTFFYYDDDNDETINNRYRYIRFIAIYNKDGDHEIGEKHAFSLNISLVNSNEKVLPITLDPDIRNPPPNGAPNLMSKVALSGDA